ncbi:DUF2017 family protein [Leucobacter sp. M11]|uniref:DUF2017 family protein n=1 Tax=Leucobacter sp. M11 TaxID=2993565 RepID=UPI002D80F7C5|nr:DUF2017 family protein [Leucobacter sp. M11]MEB4613208.1 DUF2017 family protein [Leucobacter sp. M11]
MRILAGYAGRLTLELHPDEAALIDSLVGQVLELLQSHSSTELDPDPLLASLEVGGSSTPPEDPALARLFPDAYEDAVEASEYRRFTEQGLLNRKLQDATVVSAALSAEAPDRASREPLREDPDGTIDGQRIMADEDALPVKVTITEASLEAWVRTLTAVRLALAARLGLDSDEDHERLEDDPEARSTVLVYDWLAAIIESVLQFESAVVEDSDPEAL